MAMPPRLIMLALMPKGYIIKKDISIPTGRVKMATNADRKWSRKTMQMMASYNFV